MSQHDGGMYARDLSTGKVLWQSLGFAPRDLHNSRVGAQRAIVLQPECQQHAVLF